MKVTSRSCYGHQSVSLYKCTSYSSIVLYTLHWHMLIIPRFICGEQVVTSSRPSELACCQFSCDWEGRAGGEGGVGGGYSESALVGLTVHVLLTVSACTHTHTRTHIHTHACTHTHTHTHASKHAHIHICSHTHTHTHTCAHTCTYTQTHACMHAHTHTCTHTHAHIHARTHTHTHTHTHTYVHTHTHCSDHSQPLCTHITYNVGLSWDLKRQTSRWIWKH